LGGHKLGEFALTRTVRVHLPRSTVRSVAE
ncbi:MAG: S19 family ribosomal protein, partial [Anaerolineales bacterium]|nr:S19 family ribosomal protein [Anaerolineales bacterium]